MVGSENETMGITQVKAIVFNLLVPSQQVEIEFLVDSGADYTVIPRGILASLNITAHSERTFTLTDGRQITWPVGNARFAIGSRQGASVVVFGQDDTPALCGIATLEELGLGLDPVHRELIPIPLPLFHVCPA
jgi:predicted aspartyl protease